MNPAAVEPISEQRSWAKKTHEICCISEAVWHPRSSSVGPRNATHIPNIQNTEQYAIVGFRFLRNCSCKTGRCHWGLKHMLKYLRDSFCTVLKLRYFVRILFIANATACTVIFKDRSIIPLRIHHCIYLEQHLCVSFAYPNLMNLNSPFAETTIEFQITCCAVVSGNSCSNFIKGISCWVIVLGTYQEIFFCKKWTKFRESM